MGWSSAKLPPMSSRSKIIIAMQFFKSNSNPVTNSHAHGDRRVSPHVGWHRAAKGPQTAKGPFPAEWKQPMAMVQRDKGIYTLSVLGICRCWSKAQESDLQASKRDSD